MMRSNPTLCEDGGIGISGYALLAIFWIGFCKENLWLEFAAFSFLMHLYFASKQKMQAVVLDWCAIFVEILEQTRDFSA